MLRTLKSFLAGLYTLALMWDVDAFVSNRSGDLMVVVERGCTSSAEKNSCS